VCLCSATQNGSVVKKSLPGVSVALVDTRGISLRSNWPRVPVKPCSTGLLIELQGKRNHASPKSERGHQPEDQRFHEEVGVFKHMPSWCGPGPGPLRQIRPGTTSGTAPRLQTIKRRVLTISVRVFPTAFDRFLHFWTGKTASDLRTRCFVSKEEEFAQPEDAILAPCPFTPKARTKAPNGSRRSAARTVTPRFRFLASLRSMISPARSAVSRFRWPTRPAVKSPLPRSD